MAKLPVTQLVTKHGDNLVVAEVLEQVIEQENPIHAKEAVGCSVAIARSLAAVNQLNATNTEPHLFRQFVNAITERRGLHWRHRVE